MRSLLLLSLILSAGCSGGVPEQPKPTAAEKSPADAPQPAAGDPPAAETPVPGKSSGPPPVDHFVVAAYRMREVAVAMWAHHDVYGFFPAGVQAANRDIALSWRVQLLPFLGHDDLHREFKLDQPWDSEHNRALIKKRPDVFASPGTKTPAAATHLRTFVAAGGKHDAFLPRRPIGPQAFRPPNGMVRGRQASQIKDGTSNTFMVVEAADPVVWTMPGELEYDPAKDPPRLGARPGAFVACMASGDVHVFPADMSTRMRHLLITIDDGQLIPREEWNPLRSGATTLPTPPSQPPSFSKSTRR